MFRATFHLSSGTTIGTELDREEVERLIRDLLALPDVSPGILVAPPSDEDLAEREAQLQLVAVAIGESLRRNGNLSFLGEHARSVVVRTDSVAAVEVRDPDAPPSRAGRTRIVARSNLAPVR